MSSVSKKSREAKLTRIADSVSVRLRQDKHNSVKIPDGFKYFGVKNSSGESLLEVICETNHRFNVPEKDELDLLTETIMTPQIASFTNGHGMTLAEWSIIKGLFNNIEPNVMGGAGVPWEILNLPSKFRDGETILESLIVNNHFPHPPEVTQDNFEFYNQITSRGVNLATLYVLFGYYPKNISLYKTPFPLPVDASGLEEINNQLEYGVGLAMGGRTTLLNLDIYRNSIESEGLNELIRRLDEDFDNEDDRRNIFTQVMTDSPADDVMCPLLALMNWHHEVPDNIDWTAIFKSKDAKKIKLADSLLDEFLGETEVFKRVPFPRDFNAWNVIVNDNGDTIAHLAARAEVRLPDTVRAYDITNNEGQTVADVIRTTGLGEKAYEDIPEHFGIDM